MAPDRWAVTIGSTIVWKAVSDHRIDAPDRGIYSHHGPDGTWLPGAASSAGARVLATWATDAELATFDRTVAINLMGVVNGAKLGYPWLKATPGGLRP